MKGLVYKDIKLMIKMDKKIPVIMYVFAIVIAFLGNADRYALLSTVFFPLFVGMHLVMTLTYDGLSAWKEYEMTLTMTVKQIVGSKYLSCLCILPISLIGSSAIYLVRWIVYHSFSLEMFAFSAVVAIVLPLFWCSICLALAQWVGYMNVQYVRSIGILLALLFIRGSKNFDLARIVAVVQNPVILLAILLGIVLLTYFICVAGYMRKQ